MNRIKYDNGSWKRLPDYPLPPLKSLQCPICGLRCEAEYKGIPLCRKKHKEVMDVVRQLIKGVWLLS